MDSDSTNEIIKIAVLAVIGLYIAWRLGFFRWAHTAETWAVAPRGSQVFIAFLVYLSMQLLILPSLAVGWVMIFEDKAAVHAELSKPVVEGWLNFAGIAFTLPLLVWYSLHCGATLWERRTLSSMERAKNVGLGVVVWLVAFPLVSLVVMGVRDLLQFVVEVPPLDQVAVRHLKETFGYPLLFALWNLAILALVPIIEELLFRGFLQNWLRSILGRRRALVLTALAFTVVHYSPSQGIANIQLIAGLFLLALFLGFLYERQQCLWACIGLHCTFNAFSIVFLLIGLS